MSRGRGARTPKSIRTTGTAFFDCFNCGQTIKHEEAGVERTIRGGVVVHLHGKCAPHWDKRRATQERRQAKIERQLSGRR